MKMDHFKNYVCSFEGGGRHCFAGFLQLRQRGCSSLWRKCFSLRRPLAEQTLNPGSAAVLTWLSCSLACGDFPDEGSDPRPLCWQADVQPRDCQGNWETHHSGEGEEDELFVGNTVTQVLTGLCTEDPCHNTQCHMPSQFHPHVGGPA